MKQTTARDTKCVIGKIMSLPNKLKYLANLSEITTGHWVGYCDGDEIHDEHLIIIHSNKKNVRYKTTTSFARPNTDELKKRLFKRQQKLRCPKGKCYMTFQKRYTNAINLNNVDIYHCKGNNKGGGHSQHFVRIEHGLLDGWIYGLKIPLLIVTME